MNARLTATASSIACLFLASAVIGGEPADKPVKKTIRADDIQSTIVTIILVQAFFIVFYRRAMAPLLIGSTAGIGIVIAFGRWVKQLFRAARGQDRLLSDEELKKLDEGYRARRYARPDDENQNPL